MGTTSYVEVSETTLPLELVVNSLGTGPVTGLSPTVEVRDGTTTNVYLDFSDDTFKAAGWVQKALALVEIRPGVYAALLDVSAIVGVAPGLKLVAEYVVASPPDPPDVAGIDVDVFLVTETGAEVTLVRKYHTNRMIETSGNPGHLKLYDDDDATLLREHELRDETGGGITTSAGSAARRSQGTP